MFEIYHPEIIYDPFRQQDWSFLYDTIESLPTSKKRRIRKKFFLDMKMVEIARQEKVSKQAVSKSIDKAIRLMRKK